MEKIECIQFRAAGRDDQETARAYLSQMAGVGGRTTSLRLKVYQDINIEGDIWIYVYSSEQNGRFETSAAAMAMMHELRCHGHIRYAQLVELDVDVPSV